MKFLLTIALFLPLFYWSQLSTNTSSPAALVQDVLLGEGVQVSNIKYTGDANAIGFFSGPNTSIGIKTGIVMTTGTIHNSGAGPHGPNRATGAGLDNKMGGFAPLSNLIDNQPTFNAAILEFDVTPYSDTLKFKYTFGSEEYPEFVSSEFNDVFAFFITGPGYNGLTNIAKLPNGKPVSIHNVNNGETNSGPCVNCNFYVDNGNGTESPKNNNPFYIQYDGLTKVLQAVAKVQCGQTYHLILAIADAGDGLLDSGIFLEANSLSSPVPIEFESTLSFSAFGDSKTMGEGCVKATIKVKRVNKNNAASLVIPIAVSGSATEGIDYSDIPATITIPANASEVSFEIDAFGDALPEGMETLFMDFTIIDACGKSKVVRIDLNINDVAPVNVTIVADELTCPGEPITLRAVPTGGVGPFTYLWSTGESTATISVAPVSSANYSVTVNDNCLKIPASDQTTVIVPVFDPMATVSSPDIVEICPFVPSELRTLATGGSGVYTFQWISSIAGLVGSDSVLYIAPPKTATYVVTVRDQCGNFIRDTVEYTITSPPLVVVPITPITICPEQPTTISVSAMGGMGTYYYRWIHSSESTASVVVAPAQTTTYSVLVSDDCKTFTIADSVRVIVVQPLANFEVSSRLLMEGLPIAFHNLSKAASEYLWQFGDGNQGFAKNPVHIYENHSRYQVTLIAINEIGCRDTISKPIVIQQEYWIYIPNSFTPDESRVNNMFTAVTVNIAQLTIQIFNRWGQCVFSSQDPLFSWDGVYDGEMCPVGLYTYKIQYVTTSGIDGELIGHLNLLR